MIIQCFTVEKRNISMKINKCTVVQFAMKIKSLFFSSKSVDHCTYLS